MARRSVPEDHRKRRILVGVVFKAGFTLREIALLLNILEADVELLLREYLVERT